MTHWATFRLSTVEARQGACRAIVAAPEGYVAEIKEVTRNLDQNAAAHAALTDIAKQVTWHGKRFNVLTWKRLTQASYLREIGEQVELIPALDGNGFDVIYEKSSQWGVRKFSGWLDWIYKFGAENGVTFRETRYAA